MILPVAVAIAIAAAAPDAGMRAGRIVIYDGYGSPTECAVNGRVIEDKGIELGEDAAKRGRLRNLVDNLRTLETDEIAGAVVEVELRGIVQRATTDADGNFELRFSTAARPITSSTIAVSAKLIDDRGHPTPPAVGMVHIIGADAQVAVISDFDDTIAKTDVRDRKKMLENTFYKNAAQVAMVEGISRAYPAAAAAGARAFFYVSGSPHSFHDRIRAVLDAHKLPRGPIVLKNFGEDSLTEQEGYKISRIRTIMDTFPHLRFVLIGDSGEKDPEIYRAIQAERPDRVVAILIRRAPKSILSKERFEGMTLFDDYRKDSSLVARFVRRARAR